MNFLGKCTIRFRHDSDTTPTQRKQLFTKETFHERSINHRTPHPCTIQGILGGHCPLDAVFPILDIPVFPMLDVSLFPILDIPVCPKLDNHALQMDNHDFPILINPVFPILDIHDLPILDKHDLQYWIIPYSQCWVITNVPWGRCPWNPRMSNRGGCVGGGDRQWRPWRW